MEKLHVSLDKTEQVMRDVFVGMGFSAEDAAKAASTLAVADARGVDTHGIARMAFYEKCITTGEINLNPQVKVLKETPISALLDCDNGFGVLTANQAMDMAIEKAKKNGVGIISAVRGHHFATAGYYTLKASKEDLIGYAAAPALAVSCPTGSKSKILGNSPNSLAFPAGHHSPPMMMDMACTAVAVGKVEVAWRKGEQVPKGWILDKDGNETTNPGDFVSGTLEYPGSLVPMAGPKGYCLIAMVELLSGVLPGASVGKNITGFFGGIGYFMMAMDPSILRDINALKTDLDAYYDSIKNAERRDGVDEIFLPGEIEMIKAEQRRRDGIDLNPVTAREVVDLGIKYGVYPQGSTVEEVFLGAR